MVSTYDIGGKMVKKPTYIDPFDPPTEHKEEEAHSLQCVPASVYFSQVREKYERGEYALVIFKMDGETMGLEVDAIMADPNRKDAWWVKGGLNSQRNVVALIIPGFIAGCRLWYVDEEER
jgi:hypothetical protein